jgi:hypothetical protein
MDQKFCPKCRSVILPNTNFCPSCGFKVKDPAVVMTLTKQVGLYLVSFLLPPLGLWPGIKYLKNPDEKIRHVGLIAIFLTVFSIIISIWAYVGFIKTINKTLNQQINIEQLGY